MRKKTITILFIIGVVLAIIGSVVFGIASASVAAAVLNASNAAGATQDSVNAAAAAAGAAAGQILIGGIILFIGSIFSLISWIGALVAKARQGRWGWFVCVLLLIGLGELIYLIAGPGFKGTVAAAPQM